MKDHDYHAHSDERTRRLWRSIGRDMARLPMVIHTANPKQASIIADAIKDTEQRVRDAERKDSE